MLDRLFSGIFGHFFLRASIIQSALGLILLATVFPYFDRIADEMEAEQGRTFANSTLAATNDALYKEDFALVVDYCMGVMNNTPNILFIVFSRIDGQELILRPTQWSLESKTLPYYKMVFENSSLDNHHSQPYLVSDKGHPLNPSGVYEFTRPVVIGGNDWGVLTVGFSKEAYYSTVALFYWVVLAITVISIFLSFYFFFASTRRIRGQISALEGVAKILSEGQLSCRASESAIGEIGVLGNAINRMSVALTEKSERLLQLARVLEQTDESFVLFDDSLRTIFANDALSNLTGYPLSTFMGQSLDDFFSTINLPVSDGGFQAHLTPLAIDTVITRKDKTTVDVGVRQEFISSTTEGVGYRVIVLSDISERKSAEYKLQIAANVFSHAHESIMITSQDGLIIDVNEMFSLITGYSRDEVLGKNPRILQSGRHSEAFYAAMWEYLNKNNFWHGEIWNRRKDGQVYPEWKSISAVRDKQGIVRQYVSLGSDITQQKVHEAELVHIAKHDHLTDLPNRALLADRLNYALAQARRDRRLMAVMFLDLDKFKPVNDTFGHEIGDKLLQEVAMRIQDCIRREADTVSRLGGDEFVILLSRIETKDDAAIVAGHVLEALTRPFKIEQNTLSISTSIGIAVYPNHGEDAQLLMKNADSAMYDAKDAGRGCYRFYIGTEEGHTKERSLRAKADDELSERPLQNRPVRSAEEVQHELAVHQIELQMQGEELLKSNLELEKARDRYLALFDFAPVAMLTITENGVIQDANMTAATLLGTLRSNLLGAPFSRFLPTDECDQWHLYCQKARDIGGNLNIRLPLLRSDGLSFNADVHCVAIGAESASSGFRISFAEAATNLS